MKESLYLLPVWIRLWHWTNAVLIIVLTITGISLHFGVGTLPLVEFGLAANIHDIAGLALALAYAVFFVGNIVTGNWWQYVPKPPGILDRCWRQTRWYMWGIFKGEPHPFPLTLEVNFNALQALIYWFIMYLVMPALLLTGLVFMFPQFAPDRLFGMDGLLPVAVLHYLLGTVVVMFLIAHVYLGTTGNTVTSIYKTMITGWHHH